MTDSRGVITGQFPVATSQPTQPAVVTQIPSQPGVVTSQPAVVTTQPAPADIPAVGTGITTLILPGTGSMFNQTRTVVVSANNSTTVQIVASTPTSGSDATGSGASGSGPRRSGSGASGASASATPGAAANVKVAAGSLLGFGAFVAAFL
jgi:hypothetical protein